MFLPVGHWTDRIRRVRMARGNDPWGTGLSSPNKNLVLAAMVFAVAMTFIDQTIVAIAIPEHRERAGAVGRRLAVGHQRLPAGAVGAVRVRRQARRRAGPAPDGGDRGDRVRDSLGALCGFTPKGSIAETWIIVSACSRAPAAAVMFPAAVAIVVASFPVRERGKAHGHLLRDLRWADRDRPDRRRLSDPVDLAVDLLDQHPGRAHRAVPDLALEARRRAAPDPAGLPRHRAGHRRDGPHRARAPAVLDLGVEQRRNLGVHRHRGHPDGGVHRRGAAQPRAAAAPARSSATGPSPSTPPRSA